MGSYLSRHRATATTSPAGDELHSSPSCREALSAVAAEHWLTVEQLHHLFIVDGTCSSPLSPPHSSPTAVSSASLLSNSPALFPASTTKCSATRHAPSCCCASSSLPAVAQTTSLPAFRPFDLDSSPLPPPSPADLAVAPASADHRSYYRPAAERDALYTAAIRPLLHCALLANTELDPDSLSLTLDFLVQPPVITPNQLIGLALLSPQHLHPAQAVDAAAAVTLPAFSDLTLSESGCFVHRRGTVDRARSMRAQELRLNFATVQKGLWKVSDGGQQQLTLDVYRQEEFYFEQRLHKVGRRALTHNEGRAERARHKDKAHRCASMRIIPYEEDLAKQCCRENSLCLVNQLLLVCGQETI